MMQAASDIYLGWTKGVQEDRHYYWRQLRDMKASAVVDTMSAAVLELYAGLCGWTLARAHARSGDAVAIAEYLGGDEAFDTSITDFSQRYADQNEQDYQALVAAIGSGRVPAVEGI
jgi:predicted alpha/beta hydrolase